MRFSGLFLLLSWLLVARAEAATLVACADEYCPFNCAADRPDLGYMIELLQRSAQSRQEHVIYKVMPWERAIQFTREGQCQALVGTPVNDPSDFIFPALPAGMNINVAWVKRDDHWRYNGVASLANRQIGLIDGYSYGDELDRYIATHVKNDTHLQIIAGETAIEQNVNKLTRGRINVYVEDLMVIQYRMRQQKPPPFIVAGEISRLPFHIAFSPRDTQSRARADALSQTVAKMRASGELTRLLNRYGVQDWQ